MKRLKLMGLQELTPGPYGVMFHRFTDSRLPDSQGSLNAHQLKSVLDQLMDYELLSPQEWLQHLDNRSLSSRHRCLTFDDGLKCQFEIALPILESRGLRAFWFIHTSHYEGVTPPNEILSHLLLKSTSTEEAMRAFCGIARATTDFVEPEDLSTQIRGLTTRFPFYTELDCEFRLLRDALSTPSLLSCAEELAVRQGTSVTEIAQTVWIGPDEVKRLSDRGQYVGLHSHTHPRFISRFSNDKQRAEYSTNLARIERITGVRPKAMAHPFGDYNSESLRELASLDVKCGFRSDHQCGFRITPEMQSLEIARLDASLLVS
ncbi:MAG: polysaccharide deacetylase family protein [Acidimicrobiia bacterium]|nr:polysaccharide deacetylase family protein [Acidimicrobiia bacterium]